MSNIHLGKVLFLLLLAQVYSSNADDTDDTADTRTAQCKANSTIPKLQNLMEESVQKVLREFGFDKNQTENCECPTPECLTPAALQECPEGWFRIINSCIWVSPLHIKKLNFENATLHCMTKLPNARLFEPRTQMLNDIVAELITIIDGAHRNNNFWLGMNDKVNENQYVYLSLQKNR